MLVSAKQRIKGVAMKTKKIIVWQSYEDKLLQAEIFGDSILIATPRVPFVFANYLNVYYYEGKIYLSKEATDVLKKYLKCYDDFLDWEEGQQPFLQEQLDNL